MPFLLLHQNIQMSGHLTLIRNDGLPQWKQQEPQLRKMSFSTARERKQLVSEKGVLHSVMREEFLILYVFLLA